MKKTVNNEVANKKESFVVKAGMFLNRHMGTIMSLALMVVVMSSIAMAVPDADDLWDEVADLIETWVTRLGAVVMFVGGVMFGLGWKSDDAEQKSRGISTLISGAIVVAVAALTTTFFD